MGEPQEPVPPSGYMTLIPLSGEISLDLSSMLTLAITFSARCHIHNMHRSMQLIHESSSVQILAGPELESETRASC